MMYEFNKKQKIIIAIIGLMIIIAFLYYIYTKEDDSIISTEEIEIVLNTHDDVNKMYKIIETLGYSIKCIVDKERNVYKKGDIEISLDNVNGLGNFIEIEINGEENQENLIRLKKTAKQLGLSIAKQIKNGYPNLLQEKIKETQRS